MYLTDFTAKSLKCFSQVRLTFPAAGGHAGWHVLLGGNATGKTTLLQAMATALIGPAPAMRLVTPTRWVRHGATFGEIFAEFVRGDDDVADARRKSPYSTALAVVGDAPATVDDQEYAAPQVILRGRGEQNRGLVKGPYSASKAGWLVCGYGAYRRFSGGAEDDLSFEGGRIGRVASLFRESVALKRNLEWLPRLYARSLDTHSSDSRKASSEYRHVRTVIDHLLPSPVQIADVDTQRVYFSAPGAPRVELPELSDGFRSFLALVIDLLRQITDAFGEVGRFVSTRDGTPQVNVEGVVFIDEIDQHLHPAWQRTIGENLVTVFPRLQFIVSSHSALVAQSARRDGLFVLRTPPTVNAPVGITQAKTEVAGWPVQQLLLDPVLFGLTDTRSPRVEKLLQEHATLVGRKRGDVAAKQDLARLGEVERQLDELLTSPGEPNRAALNEAMAHTAARLRNG